MPDPVQTSTPQPTPPEFNKKSLGPVLVGALVLLLATLSALFFPQTMARENYATSRWSEALKPEMTEINGLQLSSEPAGKNQRLLEQVKHISSRAKHHFEVMVFFYLNYYMQLMLGAVFGGLAAISLMLVTKAGWERANRYLVSFFLTTSVSAAFFFGFPNLCKMDENVAKNKALYLKYVSLLNDARTFCAIGDFVRETKTDTGLTANEFILHLDTEMREANDVAVSFDPGKYPIYKMSTASAD